MDVRTATLSDLPCVLKLYADARAYMAEQGNPHQWEDRYPAENLLREDIAKEQLYLCIDGEEILGVFCFFFGNDPTYHYIEDGAWLNDAPYGVLHRIAVSAHGRGVASFCYDFCLSRCKNLKVDTYKDNYPMQRSLAKNGFSRCGTIYLENGAPRIAFQKSLL